MCAQLRDYPLGAFSDGAWTAGKLVLGPWLGGMAGVLLGVAVLWGAADIQWGWITMYAMLFMLMVPADIVTFTLPSLLFAAGISTLMLRFWFVENYRLESVFVLCLVVMANVMYLCAEGTYGPWRFHWELVGRAGACVGGLAGLYLALRFRQMRYWLESRREARTGRKGR